MAEISCCKKGLVYTFLGLNIFLSLLICFLLSFATYDTIFLDWYQYIYLVLAYIVWLLLFCFYVAKLVLILIGLLPGKYVRLSWLVLNIPAGVFFLIAFIFDLVMYGQEEILWNIYIIFFVLVFILFIVFTLFDFFLINIQIQMGENNKSCCSKEEKNNTNLNEADNINNNNLVHIENSISKNIKNSELNEMKDANEIKVLQKKEGEKEYKQIEKIKDN